MPIASLRFDVYEVSLIDSSVIYRGQVIALDLDGANSVARLQYPYDHGANRLDVEPAK